MNKMNTTLCKSIALVFFLGFLFQSSFAQVFWSEDFTNGIPSDWGNVDLKNNNGEWTWCDDPTATSGTGCPGITAGQMAFGATTATTGFVTVASDEIGDNNNFTHTSELTTSVIDCSDHEEVWLSFETTIGIYVMPASANVFLQVSTDSISWENYLVFPTLNGTDVWSANPELVTFNLTDIAAEEPTVYLRWRWQAGWEYYWNLDDINLYESNPAPPHDLRVNTNWFATYFNSMTPGSQVETFGFMADVENIGSAAQTNVTLNMEIENNFNGESVYDVSIDLDTIFVAGLVQNLLFPDAGFLSDSDPAVYTGVYTVTADSMDANFSNNQITFGFEVTDSIFAKDSGLSNATGGAPPINVWGPEESYSWAYGNYYYVPNGDGMFATRASFAIANASEPGIADEQINIRLYKWNEDTDNDESMDPSEREWVGSAIYTIAGDESQFDLITVPLYTPVNSEPVELEDETAYVLMLEYAATEQKIIAFMITRDTDYAPTIYRTQELGDPRYAALLAFGEPLSAESYSTFGFGRHVVPVAQLHISEYPLVSSVDDVLGSDNKVAVYPNPADDFIHVNIELTEQQDKAIIEIIDLNGKVLKYRSLENLQKTQLKFYLEDLPNGSYFLNLNTPEGQRTVPFTKVKGR